MRNFKPQMEGGEEAPGFTLRGSSAKQVFEGGGRTAILAGVHLRNRVLEQRRLFVVAEAALLLDLGENFLSDFRGRFLSDRTV